MGYALVFRRASGSPRRDRQQLLLEQTRTGSTPKCTSGTSTMCVRVWSIPITLSMGGESSSTRLPRLSVPLELARVCGRPVPKL